jgi:hypothetical protein
LEIVMNNRFCTCKSCKKARKKGLVLGSMWAHYWVFGGLMKVSAYVPYHRWQKGRRPDKKWNVDY